MEMLRPVELDMTIPFKIQAERSSTSSQAIQRFRKEHGHAGPVAKGTQIVVTDYSLDMYLAQQFNINLDKQNRKYDFNTLVEKVRPKSGKITE